MARSFLGQVKRNLKGKATNSAKQTLYMGMWGQPIPKGKKKV